MQTHASHGADDVLIYLAQVWAQCSKWQGIFIFLTFKCDINLYLAQVFPRFLLC